MTIVYNSHPYGLLDYTSPSAKMTRGPDGLYKFRPHNLYLNSAAPANQSITLISGATYRAVVTGSVSTTASGATAGVWTVGQYDFTAATTTLTLASTSGAGTVAVYRTPCEHFYLATTSSAAYGLPFEWNVDGTLKGLVREQAATNLITNTTLLTSGLPIGANVTVTGAAGNDLSGNALAMRVARNTASTAFRGVSIAKAASALPYCFSFAVEREIGDFLNLTLQTAAGGLVRVNVCFNLSTGTISSPATAIGAFTTPLAGIWPEANGKWIVWVAGTSDTTTSISSYFSPRHTNTSGGVDGSDTGSTASVLVSDPQLEAGLYPSSRIPTHGASAGRAVDNITEDVASFMSGATEYGMYVEAETRDAPTNLPSMASLRNAAVTNRAELFINSAQNLKLLAMQSSAFQADLSSGASGNVTPNVNFRVAGSWTLNDFRVSANGGAVQSDVAGTLPSLLEVLALSGNGNFILKKVHIYKRALTNAELISLSTNGVLA